MSGNLCIGKTCALSCQPIVNKLGEGDLSSLTKKTCFYSSMKKSLVLVLLLCGSTSMTLRAQTSSSQSAYQAVQLELEPAIDLQFTNTNSSTGNTLNLPFNSVNQYTNGVTSTTQEIKVRSNKNFKISVQADASNFMFSGSQGVTASNMPVSNILFLSVTNNNTGGTIPSTFNNTYQSLTATSQDIVINGQQGGDQRLAFSYKAIPDLNYPAGLYSVGVIYTATQP
jgi:hypothetical protein